MAKLFKRRWPHVERKYVFCRQSPLKVLSAVADDAVLTRSSLKSNKALSIWKHCSYFRNQFPKNLAARVQGQL